MYRHLKLIKKTFLYDTTTNLPIPKTESKILKVATQEEKDLTLEIGKFLIAKRAELATKNDCMPYMIASNMALTQMSTIRPLNLDEMKAARIDGFNDAKIHKFGKEFLKIIQEKLSYLPSSSSGGSDGKMEMKRALSQQPMPGVKITPRIEMFWALFEQGKSIQEIAQIRGIAESTASEYVATAIKCGFPIGKRELATKFGVDSKTFEHIRSKIPKGDDNYKMGDIKNLCLPHITWEMLKLVLAYVQVRKHLQLHKIDYEDFDLVKLDEPMPVKEIKKVDSNENLWDDDDDDLDMSIIPEFDAICADAMNEVKLHSVEMTVEKDQPKEIGPVIIDETPSNNVVDLDEEELRRIEEAIIMDDENSEPFRDVYEKIENDKKIETKKPATPSKRILYIDDSEDEDVILPKRRA